MTEPRLRTTVWVSAQVRRCNIASIPIVVARHGDDDGGLVIVKLDRLDGTCGVVARTRNLDGNIVWRSISGGSPVSNMQAEIIIEREVGREAEIKFLPLQKGDVVETCADIEDAKKVFGFDPKTNISEGLIDFICWYRDYHKV